MQDDEIRKDAEARRREKEEDAIARKRVLQQIERDREERRLRQAGINPNTVPSPAPAAQPIISSVPARDYNETRIQIR